MNSNAMMATFADDTAILVPDKCTVKATENLKNAVNRVSDFFFFFYNAERIPVFDSTSEVGLEGELMCIRSVTRIAGEILKGRNASGYFVGAFFVEKR